MQCVSPQYLDLMCFMHVAFLGQGERLRGLVVSRCRVSRREAERRRCESCTWLPPAVTREYMTLYERETEEHFV